jgi:hypothetical protein
VPEQLRGGIALVCVIDKHFHYHLLGFCGCIRKLLGNALEFFGLKFELHMGCIFLKLVNQFLRRRAHNIVDFMNLVELVVSGEQRVKRKNFEEDATHAPDVHFVTVVAVSHQALRRAVPTGRNILSQWRLAVEASATAKVRQFDGVTG